MIIIPKKYMKNYYQLLVLIFGGLLWHFGNYGSKGEYIIAMLLVLIYWNLKEGRSEQ